MAESEEAKFEAEVIVKKVNKRARLLKEANPSKLRRIYISMIFGLMIFGYCVIFTRFTPSREVISTLIPILILLILMIQTEGVRIDRRIDALIELLEMSETESKS